MNLDNTLWMGGIFPHMTETQILNSFNFYNVFPTNVKLIKDKQKNKNRSYCFISFKSFEEANNVLHFLNGKQIPQSELIFNLNWADYQGSTKTVYVGDLNTNITKDDLFMFFKQKYNSVQNARIILGENGVSKGFGFVVFKSEEEYYKCLKEMNGVFFGGNVIKVKEQIKKEENNHKKKKGNISGNNIYIKNNMININSIANFNDILIQNNNINNSNNFSNNINNYNIHNLNLGNDIINNSDNKIINLNYINENNNNLNPNNIMGMNNFSNFVQKDEKTNNNFNSNQSINNLINKMNSSSFFLNANKININSKLMEDNKSKSNEQKLNVTKNNSLKLSKQKEEENQLKIKKEKNGRKKIKCKLEVLEKIDETTLYRKIHESILRTFCNHKILSKTGIVFKSKSYIFLINFFTTYSF